MVKDKLHTKFGTLDLVDKWGWIDGKFPPTKVRRYKP